VSKSHPSYFGEGNRELGYLVEGKLMEKCEVQVARERRESRTTEIKNNHYTADVLDSTGMRFLKGSSGKRKT